MLTFVIHQLFVFLLSIKVPVLQNGKMSSLLFNRLSQDDLVMDEKHILDLLQKYKSAPDSSRPDIFTDLVHSLRKFSHPQLNNLFYNQIKDNELQNLVLDALPLLKTDAGITLMKDLVDSKKLPGTILDIWFSTLPYYHNPTRSMLVTAAVSKKTFFSANMTWLWVVTNFSHNIIFISFFNLDYFNISLFFLRFLFLDGGIFFFFRIHN